MECYIPRRTPNSSTAGPAAFSSMLGGMLPSLGANSLSSIAKSWLSYLARESSRRTRPPPSRRRAGRCGPLGCSLSSRSAPHTTLEFFTSRHHNQPSLRS